MTEAIVKESNLAARQFISLMTQLAKRNLFERLDEWESDVQKRRRQVCAIYIKIYIFLNYRFFLSNRDVLFNKKALQNAIRQLIAVCKLFAI